MESISVNPLRGRILQMFAVERGSDSLLLVLQGDSSASQTPTWARSTATPQPANVDLVGLILF
jgi:hypothetical protein